VIEVTERWHRNLSNYETDIREDSVAVIPLVRLYSFNFPNPHLISLQHLDQAIINPHCPTNSGDISESPRPDVPILE
jgi:hypothetical protein